MSAFEDVDNPEYKYFNYNIAVEDSFAKRGLDQTEKLSNLYLYKYTMYKKSKNLDKSSSLITRIHSTV